MRALFLGPDDSPTLAFLREYGETVTQTSDPVTAEQVTSFDFLVSHGYRHILKSDVLAATPAVNLHISYLPWNRGADPNLWSWVEETPQGVTIHWIDEGIDTGPVVAQRRVDFPPGGTLASTYAILQDAVTALFREWWPTIKAGRAPAIPQIGEGSYHRVADRGRVAWRMRDGWDTRVNAFWHLSNEHV